MRIKRVANGQYKVKFSILDRIKMFLGLKLESKFDDHQR